MALSKEQQEYLDQLNLLAESITKRVITPEYAHMLELWKAFLGGFIGPEIAKLTPEAINEKHRALMGQYTKEALRALMTPKIIEKKVEVEKIKYVEAINRPTSVEVEGVSSPVMPVDDSHRRYRPRVNKISRKKRELLPEERRDVILSF